MAGSTRVCNPGISQCSSFGIGLPLNVLGSLALWFVLLQYMESNKPELAKRIMDEKILNDEIEASLKAAVTEFKNTVPY